MFKDRYRLKLSLQHSSGLYRNPPPIRRREGKYIISNGSRLLNFASNDYLGLGASEKLRRKVADHFIRYGSSSSSSRLVSANFEQLTAVEKAYADYFGYEAALFFSSGYQANLGVLATLFESGDNVFFDKHIHASSVKGLILSGVAGSGFNHSDFAHLQKRLHRCDNQSAVVTESLFSMDGDCLDTAGLLDLKEKYGFFCVVDEAHAFGVLGPGGRGLAGPVADVAVGTFGKALGLFGAFALMTGEVKDFLLNFSSPQIYTTTLPEAHAASARDALEMIKGCDRERKQLVDVGRQLRQELVDLGFSVDGDAHILAVGMGDEASAVNSANHLFDRGIFVLPARYPTVPMNKAILRISLTADHTEEDAAFLVKELRSAHR